MSDPTRDHHAAKLYYTGEQPELKADEGETGHPDPAGSPASSSSSAASADASDDMDADGTGEDSEPVGPCPVCPEAFDDRETLEPHILDEHPEFQGNLPSESGSAEPEQADEEELLEEMGPANIGTIAIRGVFERYECQCGSEFDSEDAAMNPSDDTGHTLGWIAYNQLPNDYDKAMAKVAGPSTMR